MLINCNNCNSIYDIEDNLIPEKGKKLRCAKCGNVWLAKKEDAIEKPDDAEYAEIEDNKTEEIEEENTALNITEEKTETEAEQDEINPQEEQGEIKEIFNRLASQTEEIFKHDESNKLKKIASESFGLRKKANRVAFVLLTLILIALALFYARFEITRAIPAAKQVYTYLGIKSTIPGYGLEFQNITRLDLEEDYVTKLEIKGFIVNTTNDNIDIHNIHIELLDKDTNVVQIINNKPPMKFIPANDRVGFRVVVTKPSPLTKYIVLTFTD